MKFNRYALHRVFLLFVVLLVAENEHIKYARGQQKSVGVLNVNPFEISSGVYKSPDGKYAFRYSVGDGAISDSISLYCIKDKKKSNLLKIKHLDTIGGFVWVPQRNHTLVFAVQRTKGKPFIASWDSDKMKVLIVGNLPPKIDPAAEYFTIVGVTCDGSKVIYKHFDATTPHKESIINKTEKLRHGLTLRR